MHCVSRFEHDEEMSEIVTTLWNLDENCCHGGSDYEVDLQGKCKTFLLHYNVYHDGMSNGIDGNK